MPYNPVPGPKPVKFYAVINGRQPGVYNTWRECEAQVKGFGSARFKSFPSLGEAHAFIVAQGALVSAPSAVVHQKPTITRSEADSSTTLDTQAVRGVQKAPPATMRAQPAAERQVLRQAAGEHRAFTESKDAQQGPAKRQKMSDPVQKLASAKFQYFPLPVFTSTSFQPARGDIYIDGACIDSPDGQRAGVGVYFGPNDKHNVSARVEGRDQTSCRAEFAACLLALRRAKRQMISADCAFTELLKREREADERAESYKKMRILTDCQLLIDACTKYMTAWITTGRNKSGKVPKNLDLLLRISEELRGHEVQFVKVQAHSGNPGNDCADALAKAGAMKDNLMTYQVTNLDESVYSTLLDLI